MKRYDDTSEEKFLKNKARRKNTKTVTEKRKKKNSSGMVKGLKTFGIILGCFIALLLILALIWLIPKIYIYFFGKPVDHNTVNDTFVNNEGITVDRETSKDGTKKFYTFLATATDRAGALTDVIMIARLTFDDKSPEVSILQIPRDSYVKISSSKLHFNPDGSLSKENFSGSDAKTSIKINEVYYRGKNLASNTISSLLKEVDGKSDSTIESICKNSKYKFLDVDVDKVKTYAKTNNKTIKKELDEDIRRDFGIHYLQQLIFYSFGIPTDYYAQVNIDGFRGIVDAIGGVDLNVPQRMYYVDEYQDLYIDLYPGQQHLNGKKAEQFVRFRSYVGGDVDRLDAQKKFINAFLDKLLSISTVSKVDSIVSEIEDNLYTSISFDNLLVFANKLVTMDLKSDVHMYTIPGTGEYVGAVSYYVLNKNEATKLINSDFNVYNKTILAEDLIMIDSSDVARPASTDNKPTNVDENNDEDDSQDSSTDDEADVEGNVEDESEDAEDEENTEDENIDSEDDDEKKPVSKENPTDKKPATSKPSSNKPSDTKPSDKKPADDVSDDESDDAGSADSEENDDEDENEAVTVPEAEDENKAETVEPETAEPEISEPEIATPEENEPAEEQAPADNSHLLEIIAA